LHPKRLIHPQSFGRNQDCGPVKNTRAPARAIARATAEPNDPPAPYITAFLFFNIIALDLLIKKIDWKY
jgi:hypothetical protein